MKRVKKTLLLLVVLLIFASATPALACWISPEPFEVFSDDGSKVFVFTPSESGVANARAALYEIINNERQLVYTVADLSSFAYESNFQFSTDMMHFARVFPPFGMNTFEVFSYGVRTRVVLRSDFIADYASIESYLSIGPSYTVTWRIEEHATQDTTITIHTDEATVYFDLATARFDWETVLPTHYELPPAPISQMQYSPAAFFETPSDISPAPTAQTQNPSTAIFIIVGAAVVTIAAGVFLFKRRKMKE